MAGTMSESGITSKETEHWAWTVGARAGYLLWPQVLAYIDGGFTEARFHFNGLNIAALGGPIPAGISLGSYVANGVFGGAGFEMPIDFLPGAFWRNEYRFAYYMPMNDPFTGLLVGGVVERVQPTVQTVTTSFVYKLDWNRFLH
jgi:outer membrane immunogenic protein